MSKSVFNPKDCQELIGRIDKLSPNSERLWGKMNVAQMLAHCNVTYEMVYTDKHPKPKGLMKLILKWIVKPTVCGDKPYKQSLRTAPQFITTDEKEFDAEKERLIEYIHKTCRLGTQHFDGKESASFGKLGIGEWNNMFYKHLDHHLKQFSA